MITEAAYLLRHSPKALSSLFSICDGSDVQILPLTEEDFPGILKIIDKYADQGFDMADACLMHLAEREGISQVFTLDRRHFSVFRTTSGKSLELLPPLSS